MNEALTKQFRNSVPSPWLQYIGPFLLAAVAGYASFTYAAGATVQRLSSVEKDVEQQKLDNKTFATREEEKIFKEAITRELNLIHEDVRATRSILERR
jgi:hypothetical protein